MKLTYLHLILGCITIFTSGCATKLTSFEKRRYNQGYHIDFSGKKIKKGLNNETEIAATTTVEEIKNTSAEEIRFETVLNDKENGHILIEKKASEITQKSFATTEKTSQKTGSKKVVKAIRKEIHSHKIQANTASVKNEMYVSRLVIWAAVCILVAGAIIGVNMFLGTLTITYIIIAALLFLWGAIMLIPGLQGYDQVFPLW